MVIIKKKKKSPLPFQEAGMSSQLRNLPITKRFQRYMYKTTPFSELICSTASHGVKLALHSGAFLRKNLAQTPWTVAVANMPLHAHTASTVKAGVLLPLPYSKDFVFLYKMKIKLHSSWRDAFLTQCRWSSVNYRCILAISMKWSRNKCTLCTGDELEEDIGWKGWIHGIRFNSLIYAKKKASIFIGSLGKLEFTIFPVSLMECNLSVIKAVYTRKYFSSQKCRK